LNYFTIYVQFISFNILTATKKYTVTCFITVKTSSVYREPFAQLCKTSISIIKQLCRIEIMQK